MNDDVEHLLWRGPAFGRPDALVALVVAALAWVLAAFYLPAYRAAGGESMFYQEEYGPAVMAACGRGLVNPETGAAPALTAFLHRRVDRLDCAAVPAALDVTSLNVLQGVTRYLLLAAAAVWRVAGVSWPALDIVFVAMFTVSITSAYIVMRYIAGRTLSLFATAVWAYSPMHLGNLPHLRDYSKAPFFALTLLAMALVITERRGSRLIAAGAAFGLIQGIGMGMRTDVTLNFVPFLLALFALRPERFTKQFGTKLACAGLALAVFAIVSRPILGVYREASGLWHVTLLGLTTPFDESLNIRRGPYEVGYLYDDSYAVGLVQGYRSRAHPEQPSPVFDTDRSYGDACRELYLAVATTFPADFAARMAGSLLHVLNLPFTISYGRVALGITNSLLVRIADWRTTLMLVLIGTGPLAAAAFVGLLATRSLWTASAAVALLIFWGAYPFIQFHGRHVFHLELLIVVMFVWLASLIGRSIRYPVTIWGSRRGALALARRPLALAIVLLVLTVGGMSVLRTVQAPRVRRLLNAYASAPTEPLTPTRISLPNGRVRLDLPLFEDAGPNVRRQNAMVAVEVTPSACSQPSVDVTFRYLDPGRDLPDLDFSRTVAVPIASGRASTRVFFPAVAVDLGGGRSSRFVGIELAESSVPCVSASRVRELQNVPLWVNATLSPAWTSERLYQRVYLGPILPERVWLRVARWWPRVAALG